MFLLLSCMTLLYFLDINPHHVYSLEMLSPPLVGCLFILLLMVLFAVCRTFYLDMTPCIYFLFLTLLLVSDSKVITKTDVKELTDYIFFSQFYDFMSHIQKSLIHFWLIFVWYKIGVLFHSVACSYPVFPAPLNEETLHSPLFVLNSFVKNN